MTNIAINKFSNEKRIEMVFQKAAKRLPSEVGDQLLAFLSPMALATMAAVLVAWAGSHFFGVGEIADVVLLIVGWAAVGGVAFEAGGHLINFVNKTINANSDSALNEAAEHLSKAITLLGVQLVLALLLKKKPSDTLNTAWRGKSVYPYSQAFPKKVAPVAAMSVGGMVYDVCYGLPQS